MEFQKATIIRSADKKGIKTSRSEYIFHLSSYPAQGNMGYYEGLYPNTQLDYNTHYHKIMTEIFTVLEGEFSFMLGNEKYIFHPGDTAIIPPMTPHGFRPEVAGSRLQFIFTGATNREDFFNGLQKIVTGEIKLNAEEAEAFYQKHDQYHV
ncbi:MAG: cupin domain-containing protein [Chitinophagales bacterium]